MTDKVPTPGLRLSDLGDDGVEFTTEALRYKLMLPHFSDEQREANIEYINRLIEADERRRAAPAPGQPTPGLRVDVVYMEDDATVVTTSGYQGDVQATIDSTYINELIEADERRRAYLLRKATAPEGAHDLMVDLGDMTRANLNQIALDAEYEAMVEDIIGNVNHIVVQGVPPIRAVFAMSQAFAIVLGYALRANMNFNVAKAMITQVMKSATKNEQLLRIITKQ